MSKIKKSINLQKIRKAQRQFTKEREWEKFHTPKNIAAALAVEASELLEIFLWLSDKDSGKVMKSAKLGQAVRHEIADVFYWVCRLADRLEIDLESAFWEKMEQNKKKYPVSLSKGNARKYTEFRLNQTAP